MKQTHGMNPESMKKAVIMRGTGHSQKEIALEIGVSQQTVGNWLKRLKRDAEKNGVDEQVEPTAQLRLS